MLIDFSVENYRSIADKQVISFVATKHRSEARGEPAVECEGLRTQKLLSSVVIYGANASGKSNVLRALAEFCALVGRSAKEGKHGIRPFLLDPATANEPSRFQMSFVLENVRYEYGFAVDAVRVHEEWLIAYPRRTPQHWFERRWDGARDGIHFGPSLKGEKSRIYALTRPDALFLSVAEQFNHEQLTPIVRWITGKVRVIQASYVSTLFTAELVERGSDVGPAVSRLLRDADMGIQNVLVRRHKELPESRKAVAKEPELVAVPAREKGEYVEIRTEHRCSDGSNVMFDLFADESQGTQRYFGLLGHLAAVLAHGGVLAVDELDDSLHPLIVRKIVELFHSSVINHGNGQLLFNTHDTTLLDPELFRRDQIWFTEKSEIGKTCLYSLLEFSPRKSEALGKGYLQGRYGAIPFLGDFRLEGAIGAAVARGS